MSGARRVALAALALASLILAAGCGSDSSTGGTDGGGNNGGGNNGGGNNGGGNNGGGDSRYKWTLIVFMNADNDLEPFGVDDVNEMEMLPASDDVAIVVLMDRTRGFDTSNGNWTDTRRFKIVPDNDPNRMTSAEPPNAELLGELDTGDWETARDFIVWAQTNYPADHYLFDFWNHGAGWRSRETADGLTRGVLFDDTQNTYVTTPELSQLLNLTRKVEIAAFDSSLMQMMSVAYQIRNQCDYVVGSEESPPGEGYPYDQVFLGPVENPDITPEAFAAYIVNAYLTEAGRFYEVTQSALRAAQLENLRIAIDAWSAAITPKVGQYRSEIMEARAQAQGYGSGSPLYLSYKDLVDFVQRVGALTNDVQLISTGNAIASALAAALVAEGDRGAGMADSNGVSIFMPDETDWSNLRTRYRSTAFGTNSLWDEWLDALYANR